MKKILSFLKPYRLQIILVLLLTLVGSLLELYLPTLMADVVDIGIVHEDIPYILKTGGWMIVFSIIAVFVAVAVSYFSAKVSIGFGKDVRQQLFENVESFSLDEFEKFGTASLITRTTNDIKQVSDVLTMMLRMMVRAPFMLIGGIVLAVSRDPQLSLIFLVSLPVLALLIIIVSRIAIPLFTSMQKKTDRLNLVLRENLTGIRVVRAFNRVEHEKVRFDEANTDFRDVSIRVNKIMAYLFPLMMIVMNFTNIAIIWFGAIRIDNGNMQVGNLMAFLQYGMMILFSLIMLSVSFIMIPRAQASAKRINEVLVINAKMADADGMEANLDTEGEGLTFKNITFRYQGAEKPALKNISFSAKNGQTTAIIGSTGSGKSTLMKLIPRFYDAEEGSILLDGVDVRNIKLKTLREKIGYVPQKAALFSGTVADNIRFGNEEVTDKQMEAALKTAQAWEFVSEKEGGTESRIEQAGANLSGGQKQRLSIARALARKPDIYLFDDSFSALDYKTDAALRHALKSDMSEAIVLIVAQRVSTVMDADQIIVTDEGKIAGVGTHETLLKENQVYQEIVSSQLNEGESA
ncbi:ABC transporter ATP-binding protein [Bacillaceae bacterium Marseille-Q3522]|nr:ABC transporter ATP-binding protein [Bacillaceae bacterium Marseille-Q3522]